MCEKVDFKLNGDLNTLQINDAYAITNLQLPTQTVSRSLVQYIAKTHGIFIQPYDSAAPKILIGQNNWNALTNFETRNVSNTDLAMSHSPLGWIVHGPETRSCAKQRPAQTRQANMCVTTCNCGRECMCTAKEIDDLVREYFLIDNLAVNESTKPHMSHSRALAILNDAVRRKDSIWEVGLLWANKISPLIDSHSTALKRLFSLEKRLDRDEHYASLYYREMQRFIDRGYAVKIDNDVTGPRVWYLPHFGVTRTEKPNKVRLVFDAAARSSGISLNDQLETGPDFLQPLYGVLIRFRQFRVAIKADIRDMYLRVQVREQDRRALRFLWRGRQRKGTPDTYEMTRLPFGARCSPSCALFVKDANAKEFAADKPIASESIIKNSYVDDYLASRESVNAAKMIIADVVHINSRANFEMHGWASNEKQSLESVSESSRVHGDDMQLCDRGGERVLGLMWDTRTDTISFKLGLEKIPFEILHKVRKPTKREFLRIIMSIFDPLGLLSHFTIRSKILMQAICRSGINWDAVLRDEEFAKWTSWLDGLETLGNCRVPRCLTPRSGSRAGAQLHTFCDASLSAYAAVVYLRIPSSNESPAHVSLIMAKSRAAPVKPLSVPRLELQAATLGARLSTAVANELDVKIDRRFLWSDSQTVLLWIRSEPRTRTPFVAHRLGEIGELTSSAEWLWVPTDKNPADIATRWSDEAVDNQEAWFMGPKFLRESENDWPRQRVLEGREKRDVDALERRRTHDVYVAIAARAELPLTARLVGWRGLLAVARRVRKIVTRWRGRGQFEQTNVDNNDCAEFWIRDSQGESFDKELRALRRRHTLPKGSRIAPLNPYEDDRGILRAKGRVLTLEGAIFNNNPIILDGRHPVTRQIIQEYHRRHFHASNETVLNELRQEYHVLGLRTALKSISQACLRCKLSRAKPQAPIMGPLPPERLGYRQRPFHNCGVDYFGPMFVKIGRRREKRWGVLFTCLTTRAVHIELAHSLSASSAIMALQRLSARRGSPMTMYSDNGTNFRGACTELSDAIKNMNKNKQREYALRNGMRWVFNPPDAPHMGGTWERMIRTIKTALQTVLKEQAPSEETLYTVLTEIEHCVNSRPLTHVSVDPRDAEALTPNHFLLGASSGALRLGRDDSNDVCLRKQWRVAQSFADNFWRRWLREYLPTLIARQKWMENTDPLRVGDMVLVVDLQAPRNDWRTGKVLEVYPGRDGAIRVAKVETRTGEYVRPVHKLIRLFVRSEVQK